MARDLARPRRFAWLLQVRGLMAAYVSKEPSGVCMESLSMQRTRQQVQTYAMHEKRDAIRSHYAREDPIDEGHAW